MWIISICSASSVRSPSSTTPTFKLISSAGIQRKQRRVGLAFELIIKG